MFLLEALKVFKECHDLTTMPTTEICKKDSTWIYTKVGINIPGFLLVILVISANYI